MTELCSDCFLTTDSQYAPSTAQSISRFYEDVTFRLFSGAEFSVLDDLTVDLVVQSFSLLV